MSRAAAVALDQLIVRVASPLWRVLVLLLTAAGSVASPQPAQPAPVVAACDLFKDLLAYSGKMITVRGQVEIFRHGWYLGPAEACPQRFIVGGKPWPNGLDLVGAGTILVSPPVSFEMDRARMGRLYDLLSFLKGRTPGEVGVVIMATFTGELRTGRIVKEMLGPVPISEHYTGAFGHMGECPAQLVIKTVEDIVITQK